MTHLTRVIRGSSTHACWRDRLWKLAVALAVCLGLAEAASAATIAAGSNVMWGVRSDGTVVQWQSNVGAVPAGLSNVTALGGGNRFALALRSDGTVVAWGQDSFGQGMLNVPAGLSNVVAVEGGGFHSMALTAPGAVVAWGDDAYGQTAVPGGLIATAIGAGEYHSLAVRSDATVVAWGANFFGQTNVPAGLAGVTAVAGGSRHSLALKSDGTVVAWGPNFFGETSIPAGLGGVTAIAAGWYHNLALRSDGTVAGWGNNDYGQATVPAGLNNVVAIAAGAYTSMALRADGSLVVWGSDPFASIQPPVNTTFRVASSPDTTPPTLVLPAPITVLAQGPSGSVVTYGATATDDTDPAPVVACSPASGSTFPIGATTVNCTATDASGNQSAGSFTVSVTVTSASVTIKGSRLRANGASQLVWKITGPSTSLTQNGDATRTLVPGTYVIDVSNSLPYGTFAIDSFGHVVSPTGSLTVVGNVVDFDLALLAGVAIPVGHLSSNQAAGSEVLAISGISNAIQGANPTYYLPPNLTGASHQVTLLAAEFIFGRFRVRPDLTLEELDLTDPLILVSDGSGPGGGPRLDFDLSRLYPFTLPYALADFVDPDSAGRVISVGLAGVAGFNAPPATLYLPATVGSAKYTMQTRDGTGVYGTFQVAADLTPHQATGAMRFDGANNFFLDFNSLVPVTLKIRQLADPFLPLSVAIKEQVSVGNELTVYLPPNNGTLTYDLNTAFVTNFGKFSIAPDLTVHTTGALHLGADGRTINFDTCALGALRISPAAGRQWRAAISATSGFYAGFSPVATTLFLPNGTYGIFFNDSSSITVTLAGGAITAANPAASVSGGSVSIGTCDSTPPVLSLPADITVPPTSPAGAAVTYSVTATDAVDPAPVVSCAPASGSTFPIGATAVTCTATDARGNSASGSFNVTVVDSAPPLLSLPGNITTPSTSPAGAVASFSVSATDAIDPAPVVSCSAVSGATFPIGLTTVTCTATDYAGNVSSGSFTIGVTVSSASVTMKGSHIRADGASQLLFRIIGPSTHPNQNGDVTITLVPGTYTIDAFNTQPYGTFTIDGFGQVVSPTGSLTAAGNVVDFNLGLLAGVAIPVGHLSSNFAIGSSVLAIPGISSLINTANPIYYFPPNLTGASHEVNQRGSQGPFGRFRVKPDLTLEDLDLTDSLILVSDGTGPGGGPRLDFDLSRLYPFTFPYAMADFGDPDSAGQVVSVGLADAAGLRGPATVYLPPNVGTTTYRLMTRTGSGLYGTFVVAPDRTPRQATGAIRFDGSDLFFLDFDAMLPVTLRIRQLADPYPGLNAGILDDSSLRDDLTVYLPPSNLTNRYNVGLALSVSFGTFTIAPGLTVQTTGALRVGTDGRTIGFDTCVLNALHVVPTTGRQWRAGPPLAVSGFYSVYSTVATTLFLPDGTYGIFFTDSSSITVTLAGGAITAASPGTSVSGGSVSIGTCDNQPPLLSLPADITVPPTNPSGAVVTYTATATDAVDPVPVVSCAPASGSTFPLGTTAVMCTATDAAGNSASGSFSVTVADQAPPVLDLPPAITAEATGASGAAVSYLATATDAIDPAPVVTCSPSSGSTFPLGTTTVTCTATDAAGNRASGSFSVTVHDTTPPAITVPANISAEATGPAGAVVSWLAPAAEDLVSGAVAAVCAPASGSSFPVGVTLVTCTATDGAGNAASGVFSVSVVDTAAPALTLPGPIHVETGSPAGATVSYAVSAQDTVDPNPAVVCSPASGSLFAVGATTVSCTARDAAGNAAHGQFQVSVSLCPIPVLTLDPAGTLPAYTNQSSLPAAGAISGGACLASAEVIVTNGASSQTIPVTPGGDGSISASLPLLEGANIVVLRAADRVGRSFATPAKTVVLDTAPPALVVLSPASGSANGSPTLSLTFSLADANPTTVSVADQSFSFPGGPLSTQPVSVSLPTEGSHTLTLSAQDAAGNMGTAQLTVLVDLTAPLASIDLADGARLGPIPGDVLPFTLTVDALSATDLSSSWGASYSFARGGGVFHGVAPLLEGVNILTFTITNEVGRVTTLSRTVTYDLTAPTGSVTSPAADEFTRGTLHLSAEVTDALTAVATVSFAIDGGNAIAGVPGTGDTWIGSVNTTTLADGAHNVVATLVDGVGNSRTFGQAFNVDNTPPAVTILTPAPGSYVHQTVTITAAATDATSGVASISVSVNGGTVGSCVISPCSVSFDTTSLGADGAFTIAATATDHAGNESGPAQISVIADNSAPANFLTSPANGQVLKASMVVSVNVVDSGFARVECFVDGVSLGVSTDPHFSRTVSLLDTLDGEVQVACRAEDLAGNAAVQTVAPTIKNWTERMRPQHLNLKSRGKYVRMAVRNSDHHVANVSVLLSRLSTLSLALPGGVAPVPVLSGLPPAEIDHDDDGDSDNDADDEPLRRVLLKISRPAFVAAVKAGIAVGAIDPKKPVTVTLLDGTHVIGSDTIRVKP